MLMRKKEIRKGKEDSNSSLEPKGNRSDKKKGNETKRKEAKANCFISLICPFNGRNEPHPENRTERDRIGQDMAARNPAQEAIQDMSKQSRDSYKNKKKKQKGSRDGEKDGWEKRNRAK